MRPDSFDFALSFLGEPESLEVLDYVRKLEKLTNLNSIETTPKTKSRFGVGNLVYIVDDPWIHNVVIVGVSYRPDLQDSTIIHYRKGQRFCEVLESRTFMTFETAYNTLLSLRKIRSAKAEEEVLS